MSRSSSTSRRSSAAFFASLFAAIFTSSLALAQALPGEVPTRGPEIPTGVIAGDSDATAVVLDAANLAFLPSWNVMALYTYLDPAGARGPSGGGLYLAAPVPYLSMLSVGAAVELVRPPRAFPYGDLASLSLALAARPVRNLGFGLTYRHVFGGSQPGFGDGGIDTLDLSMLARMGRYAALGIVVRDVNAPEFFGLGIERSYRAELDVRPLGNDRWELAPSAWIGERRADWGVGLRLGAMLYPGVLLRGSVSYQTDELAGGATERDVRGTIGLQLDLAHVGLAGYAHLGTRNLGGGVAHGFSVVARVSGDRYPALYTSSRIERVDLQGTSDRQLVSLLAHLRELERDPRTWGVLAVVGELQASWATAEELRAAIQRLRAAGKRVFAFGGEIGNKGYYVATAAERVYLDPGGGVRFVGLSSTQMYWKGALDKLSVRADFVKIAEYKSAPEQWTRTGPSDEAAEVKTAILGDLGPRIEGAIAEDRHLDAAVVRALRDQGPFPADAAKKGGLVDELCGGEDLEEAIGKATGRTVSVVPPRTSVVRPRQFDRPAVAVLFLDGEMVEGRSRTIPLLDRRYTGHETFLRAIEAARSDSRIKAILVRIDSPGGSALAADLIARELDRTRKVKPVVCSLGDVAASGGYYAASVCDVIYAEPSTLTGSIGVFTGKFDLSGLASLLGVQVMTWKRGAHADEESWFRPYTDEERAAIQRSLRYAYDRFVGTVAAGRHMKPEEVDAIGRGRVWTGNEARAHKLVDVVGGFLDALDETKRRAELGPHEEVELVSLPEEPGTLLGQLGQLLGMRASDEGIGALLRPMLRPLVATLPAALLFAPSTVQARLPLAIEVE